MNQDPPYPSREDSGDPENRSRPKKKRTKLRSKDHSIHAEPTMAAMQGRLEANADPEVSKAHARIDDEFLGESFAEEAERSVFDEPVFSSKLGGEVPENAFTYARFLVEKAQTISKFESWFLTGLLLIGSGVFAIVGSFINESINVGFAASVQFLAIAVFAPVIEEVMKTAIILWAVEQRPYWFKNSTQLMIIGMCSGLVFASIENLLYLFVYIDNPSVFIIVWRWTVCIGMHTIATMIATIGLIKIWKRVMRTGKFARAEIGAPFLFYAILFHGIYNGSMYLLGILGVM